MMYKFIALLLLVLTPIFSYIIVKLFGLNRLKLLFPDVAFPLYVLEIILVSDKFLTHGLLPYLISLFSLLALAIAAFLIFKKHRFSYKRFIKLFWRVGFLVSLLFYFGLVIYIFLIWLPLLWHFLFPKIKPLVLWTAPQKLDRKSNEMGCFSYEIELWR